LSSEEHWLHDYFPKSGRVFLDIGANEGQWTKTLATSYERVIAIEPNPQAWPKLEQNLPRNVRVIRKAVGSTKGESLLHLFASDRHASLVREESDEHSGIRQGEIKVETITVDSLGIDNVDFIKIDTEGSEYEILKGAEQTLRRLHPKLLVEIHDKESGRLAQQLLTSLSYRVLVIHHPMHIEGSELWLMHYWISC
jgi:FkbM family methyltransferase